MRGIVLAILLVVNLLTLRAGNAKYDYTYLEAVRQADMGNYALAFALFKRCVEMAPTASEAHYGLGAMYIGMRNDSLALVHTKKSTELEPANTEYQERLAQLYLYSDKIDSAVVVYEKLAHQVPDNTEYLGILIQIYEQQRDYKNMLDVLGRLEVQEGQSEQITLAKMQAHSLLGDSEGAYKEIKQLADTHPYEMTYRVLMGNWLLNNGRKAEALKTFTDVLKDAPNNAQAQMSLMDYYRTTKEEQKADSLLEGLLVNPTTDSGTRTILLGEWFKMHENASSADTKELLQRVLDVAPENIAARLQLIQILWNDSIDENVVRECRKAVEYIPGEVMLYYYLGLAQFVNGHSEDAINTLKSGVANKKTDTPKPLMGNIYSILGDAYHKIGDKKASYEAYDSCLVYAPDLVVCLNNYAYYLSVEKENLKKAEQMSYKAITAEPNNAIYLDTYAWILYQEGNYADAKTYIDMAIKNLDPPEENEDNKEIFEHLRAINEKIK